MSWNTPRTSTDPQKSLGIPVNEPALHNRHSLFPEPFQYGFLVNSSHAFRRTNPGLLRAGSRTMNAKLAIPRAAHASSSSDRARAKHACNNCREQKAKCTGRQPCQRCEDAGVKCIYGIRKREEFDKHIGELSAQNQLYHDLIRDLYPKLDALSAQHVDKTLRDRLVQPWNSEAHRTETSTGHNSHPFTAKGHSEEDFNSSEQMQEMGFVGESSATAWLYKLKGALECGNSPSGNDEPVANALSSLNYFQDEAKILALENSDPWARPSRETANHLVDIYFRTIHPEFPVIGMVTFRWQYRSYCSNPNVRPGKRWMAVLNLVFAIAAKYSSLVDGQSWGNSGDHEPYFARAWHLSIGQAALAEHPDLQQVQVEGLAAFYLLLTGQVNRAWRMIGMAIRSALAMGLNLRNVADQIPYSSKEIRYRLWWALFMIDTVLQEITGRPPNTSAMFCTTPLPIPYREEDFSDEAVAHIITDIGIRNTLVSSLLSFSGDSTYIASEISTNRAHPATLKPERQRRYTQATQTITEGVTPNVSLHFLHAVDLAHLMREVIETLYSPALPQRSWLEMEVVISKLNDSVDRWLLRLPEEFNFTRRNKMRPFTRQRISLGFRFYTAKIVICQPCLHQLAYTSPRLSSPRAVRDTMAAVCVHAARQMLDLLPDEVDMTWFYGTAPWWCALHHMMKSITVLLVELFTRTEPGTIEAGQLVKRVRKALLWLQAMSTKDPSARKAWLVCMEIVSRYGSKFALVIDDNS